MEDDNIKQLFLIGIDELRYYSISLSRFCSENMEPEQGPFWFLSSTLMKICDFPIKLLTDSGGQSHYNPFWKKVISIVDGVLFLLNPLEPNTRIYDILIECAIQNRKPFSFLQFNSNNSNDNDNNTNFENFIKKYQKYTVRKIELFDVQTKKILGLIISELFGDMDLRKKIEMLYNNPVDGKQQITKDAQYIFRIAKGWYNGRFHYRTKSIYPKFETAIQRFCEQQGFDLT